MLYHLEVVGGGSKHPHLVGVGTVVLDRVNMVIMGTNMVKNVPQNS